MRHALITRNKHLIVLAILALTLGLFSLLTSTASATTGVSPDVSFEGKIVNSSGVNITNATYNVEFTMYTGCSNEPTNNTGCTLAWTEDYLTSATQGVVMNGGTFEVNLGQYCAFSGGTCQGNTNSGINWNTYPIYMSMQIGQTTNCTPAGNFTTNCSGDSVMQPYILMTSTPYAQNAGTLGGLGSGSFAQLGTTQTFTGSNTFETNSASALTVENTSTQALLTINTSTPTVNLGVTGSVALGSTVNINNSTGAIELTNIGSTDSSSATVLQGGSGSLSLTTGTAAGNITLTTNNAASSVIAKSSTNNTTALEVQNASSQDVLNVDTQNAQVDVGALSAPGTLTATQAPLAGSLTGTAGSTSYTYEITAVSANGAESLAATETNAALANSITTHNITVNYTTNGAAYYKIYRTASAGTPSSLGLVGTSTTGSFVDTGYTAGAQPPALANTGSLAVSTTYYYEVTALDDTYTTTDNIGQTPPSTQLTATTNSYNKSLTISWAPVAGARAYNVYRTTTSGTYTTDSYYTVYTNSLTDTNTGATGTNTTPPTVSTAYGNDLSDNSAANVTIGSNGTSSAQLYVGGSVPSGALSTLSMGTNSQPYADYVVGSYAYVTDNNTNTLEVVNISIPTHPVIVGSVGTNYYPGQVTVEGNYAYVVDYDNNNTLQIFNIANPTDPVLVDTFSTTVFPFGISVVGDYAYVTGDNQDSGNGTLQIINILNPTNPVIVGTVNTTPNDFAQNVSVVGNYAYVTGDESNSFKIFNVSNPANPVLVSSTTVGYPDSIYVQGNYAYVASITVNSLEIYDISNPADPINVGSFSGASGAVYAQGRYAYEIGSSNNVQVIDISNPADPLSVGSFPIGAGSSVTPNDLFVQGRYAYLANNGLNTLQIFDLGGAYIQQLQVGGTETGTLQVDSNANVSGSESITSGLTVGNSAQISSNLGVGGNLTIAGSTQLEGITTINGVYGGYSSIGLATPSAPSITFSGTTGGAVTWSYEVEAIDAAGNTTAASPVGSITTGDSNGLGTYSSETVSSVTFATPHVTYNVPSGQPYLTGMGIVVSSCSGTGADNGSYTITSETTSTIVVSNASGVAGETGCTIAAENNYNTISWSAVTGAVNYYVFRTVDAAGGAPSTTGFIGSTTSTSLTDNATAGTATYLAQTTDSTNSFIDKTATNSTTAFQVQNASSVDVLNVDTTNAQVDVGALSAPGTLTATQAPLAGTPTGSGSGTSYTYEVTAVSANGAESLGSTETLASNGAVLSTNPITVKYTTNGAAYYKIYRTASAGTPSSLGLVGTSTTGSFVDTGYTAGAQAPALANTGSLAVSTNYYYEVTALDDTYTTTDNIGQTPPSAQLTGTTNSYNKSLTINWAPVNGARAYNVYRSTTSGTYTTDSYYTVYTNSFTDTNTGATGTNTVPPTVSSAYGNDLSDNAAANITVGSNGTAVGQLYVGGQTPTLVANLFIGGGAHAIYIQGNYAYVVDNSTNTLQVIDISNRANPVIVGSVGTDSYPGQVYIQGNYAYVVNFGSSNLQVIDISNPSSLLVVGTVTTAPGPFSVTIQGDYAYVASDGGANGSLQIINISNPASPVLVSATTTTSGNFAQLVTVQGNYAYVTGDTSNILEIFNISNPFSPILTSTTTVNDANAIYIQGNYAYISSASANALQIFDVSNPANPFMVGSVASVSGSAYFQGDYAYVAGSGNLLQVINISNPADPTIVTSAALGAGSSIGDNDLSVQGNYAYLPNNGSTNTLQVFDLGGAYVQQLQAGGIETGTLQVDSNANVSGDESVVSGLTVGGATELAGNVGVGGNVVIGASSSVNNNATTAQQLYVGGASNPIFDSQSTNANLNGANGVQVSGDYAFVASSGNSELVSYDISSGTPVYVGESNTNLNGPGDLYVQGNYAYVASGANNEMVIFNISSGIPVYVSEIGTDLNAPYFIQVRGSYAYVGNSGNGGLVVFNVSNPANPTFEGINADSHDTGSDGLYVQGNYVYITSANNNELIVYNISSGIPVYVSETSADLDFPTGVVVQGNYAYVASTFGGKIVTFDIASGTPVLVGENSDSNMNGDDWLSVQGNYIYTTSQWNSKLMVYDISSGIPVYVGENSDSSLNLPEGIFIQGNYAYVDSQNDDTLVRFNLSGEYAQQLQVGGEEVSQLQVDTNENVNGSASITGGLIVGSSAQVSGGLGVNGTLAASGSVVVDASYSALTIPTISGISTTTTGGSLTATTYYYEITALDATGNETIPSNQVSQVTTGSTSTVTLTWAPITGAESYNIYRSTTSGVYTTDSVYATQGTVSGSNLTFTDTGTTAPITNTAPPLTTSAQVATNISNSNLQVTIGGNGTPTGQLYVSGTVPTSAIGTVSVGTGTFTNNVIVQGNYAYVGNYGLGALQIVNVANPATPVVVGSVPVSYAGPVFVQGDYAYVGGIYANSLTVVNVSNPTTPVVVGSISTAGWPGSVYVSGNYAYVTNWNNGPGDTIVQVINISNPANPIVVGSVTTTGANFSFIYVQGNYAYLANSGNNDLQIINISNPTSPVIISSIYTNAIPQDVYVQGDYAYMANYSSNDLQIINVSNPVAPVIVSNISTYNSENSIYVQGRYAYLTSSAYSGSGSSVGIYDISNPANPLAVGSVSTGSGNTGANAIYVQGRYAYVDNGSSNTLQVFDLGGEYSQQLQAGGAEVGTLQVDSNANISGGESITGGLAVSGATDLASSVSAGSFSITDGLATPAIPSQATTCSGTCATSYNYEVAAVNSSGTSAASQEDGTATGNATLNTTTEYIENFWTAVPDATSYNVYRVIGGSTQGLIGNVSYTTAITPTSASETGATVTLNFASSPPWSVGQGITLSGFTSTPTTINGTWPILSVTPTSITLNRLGGATSTVSVLGTATGALAFYDTGQTAGSAAPTVATAGTLTLQSTSKAALLVENASSVAELSVDTQDGIVIIGSGSSTNTTQTLLQLNSDATYSEAASCSTTTNQGSLYYNNVTNNIRACINGNWQDLVSTQDLALQLFGVVPNSGSNPGDLIGASATATAYTGGPCKVTYSSTTSVNVASCLAYSGGREVSVANTNVPIGTVALNNYENICLNSSGVPVAMGGVSATDGLQTAANLTNTNATTLSAPLLCLATIKASGTANQVGIIYDIRTFSTTIKTYGTLASATQVLGGLVGASTAGLVVATTTATSNVVGVLVAGTNAAGTAGVPNVIYTFSGPQWIKNTGTALQADYIIPTTTTGYASALSTTAATAYDQIGVNQAGTFGATCTGSAFASTDCQQSVFTDLDIQ